MGELKNLFDYATKELSQDAFLRWFLENYDNNELGPIVADFINYFSNEQCGNRKPFNLKYGDLIKVKTFAQVSNIDICVDIWSKTFKGKRSIIIEDKTGSEEHSDQLTIYNKVINNWEESDELPPEERIYKIYYKTSKVNNDSDEYSRVNDAKWTLFDIDEIYNFFKPYKDKTNSDVFNDYVNHIVHIYESYNQISIETADKWSTVNWDVFIKEKMKEYYPNRWCEARSYRGMYTSLLITYGIDKNKYVKSAAFEIIIRDKMKPSLHPEIIINGEWYWSINKTKDKYEYPIIEKELDDLRNYIENSKSEIIKRGNTVKAFGRIKEPISYKEKTADELWKELSIWIDEFNRLMDGYVRQK